MYQLGSAISEPTIELESIDGVVESVELCIPEPLAHD